MRKKLLIHNGNISIGGQEKMLMEFLNILDSKKYEILLLIEENNGKRNDYIDRIPKWIDYKFLTTEEFMNKIEKYQSSKNFLEKLYYSHLLKLKKKISLKELKKYLNFSDIIIDYDMGLLRNLHKINLQNKKIIGWSHAGSGELLKKKQKRENVNKYDCIVTINETMKNGYLKNYNNKEVVKIYNFLDFDLIEKKAEEKLEKDYEKYIISVGSLTENKNHKLLINAFKILKNKYKVSEKLLIAGEGKERENLEKQIKELNLGNDVLLLGQKENPYKYIKNSELYILPSKAEGFSLTLVEAMCLKKMIVSTHNNGSEELVRENKYGVLVENNANEMAEKINYYLENKNERKKYEELGYERAKDFSKENGKKVIEEFIDRL
ncbi:MAG: glycosyltransferase [Fusobacterium sp.]|nr:glycosyltransferase [Fusobacterium sp.]